MFIAGVVELYFCHLFLLAQAAGDGAAAPAAIDGDAGNFLSPFILPAGLLFLFYFIVIAPERRRKSDEAKLMSALKKNDRVVTIGGIHAVVAAVTAESDVVTLRIDENANTRIKVNRSAISRIVTDENTAKNKPDTSKDDAANSKQ